MAEKACPQCTFLNKPTALQCSYSSCLICRICAAIFNVEEPIILPEVEPEIVPEVEDVERDPRKYVPLPKEFMSLVNFDEPDSEPEDVIGGEQAEIIRVDRPHPGNRNRLQVEEQKIEDVLFESLIEGKSICICHLLLGVVVECELWECRGCGNKNTTFSCAVCETTKPEVGEVPHLLEPKGMSNEAGNDFEQRCISGKKWYPKWYQSHEKESFSLQFFREIPPDNFEGVEPGMEHLVEEKVEGSGLFFCCGRIVKYLKLGIMDFSRPWWREHGGKHPKLFHFYVTYIIGLFMIVPGALLVLPPFVYLARLLIDLCVAIVDSMVYAWYHPFWAPSTKYYPVDFQLRVYRFLVQVLSVFGLISLLIRGLADYFTWSYNILWEVYLQRPFQSITMEKKTSMLRIFKINYESDLEGVKDSMDLTEEELLVREKDIADACQNYQNQLDALYFDPDWKSTKWVAVMTKGFWAFFPVGIIVVLLVILLVGMFTAWIPWSVHRWLDALRIRIGSKGWKEATMATLLTFPVPFVSPILVFLVNFVISTLIFTYKYMDEGLQYMTEMIRHRPNGPVEYQDRKLFELWYKGWDKFPPFVGSTIYLVIAFLVAWIQFTYEQSRLMFRHAPIYFNPNANVRLFFKATLFTILGFPPAVIGLLNLVMIFFALIGTAAWTYALYSWIAFVYLYEFPSGYHYEEWNQANRTRYWDLYFNSLLGVIPFFWGTTVLLIHSLWFMGGAIVRYFEEVFYSTGYMTLYFCKKVPFVEPPPKELRVYWKKADHPELEHDETRPEHAERVVREGYPEYPQYLEQTDTFWRHVKITCSSVVPLLLSLVFAGFYWVYEYFKWSAITWEKLYVIVYNYKKAMHDLKLKVDNEEVILPHLPGRAINEEHPLIQGEAPENYNGVEEQKAIDEKSEAEKEMLELKAKLRQDTLALIGDGALAFPPIVGILLFAVIYIILKIFKLLFQYLTWSLKILAALWIGRPTVEAGDNAQIKHIQDNYLAVVGYSLLAFPPVAGTVLILLFLLIELIVFHSSQWMTWSGKLMKQIWTYYPRDYGLFSCCCSIEMPGIDWQCPHCQTKVSSHLPQCVNCQEFKPEKEENEVKEHEKSVAEFVGLILKLLGAFFPLVTFAVFMVVFFLDSITDLTIKWFQLTQEGIVEFWSLRPIRAVAYYEVKRNAGWSKEKFNEFYMIDDKISGGWAFAKLFFGFIPVATFALVLAVMLVHQFFLGFFIYLTWGLESTRKVYDMRPHTWKDRYIKVEHAVPPGEALEEKYELDPNAGGVADVFIALIAPVPVLSLALTLVMMVIHELCLYYVDYWNWSVVHFDQMFRWRYHNRPNLVVVRKEGDVEIVEKVENHPTWWNVFCSFFGAPVPVVGFLCVLLAMMFVELVLFSIDYWNWTAEVFYKAMKMMFQKIDTEHDPFDYGKNLVREERNEGVLQLEQPADAQPDEFWKYQGKLFISLVPVLTFVTCWFIILLCAIVIYGWWWFMMSFSLFSQFFNDWPWSGSWNTQYDVNGQPIENRRIKRFKKECFYLILYGFPFPIVGFLLAFTVTFVCWICWEFCKHTWRTGDWIERAWENRPFFSDNYKKPDYSFGTFLKYWLLLNLCFIPVLFFVIFTVFMVLEWIAMFFTFYFSWSFKQFSDAWEFRPDYGEGSKHDPQTFYPALFKTLLAFVPVAGTAILLVLILVSALGGAMGTYAEWSFKNYSGILNNRPLADGGDSSLFWGFVAKGLVSGPIPLLGLALTVVFLVVILVITIVMYPIRKGMQCIEGIQNADFQAGLR